MGPKGDMQQLNYSPQFPCVDPELSRLKAHLILRFAGAIQDQNPRCASFGLVTSLQTPGMEAAL